MLSNNDVGDCDSFTTLTSKISVKEIELKLKELDGLSLDIGLLTNTKLSSIVSLSF